MAERQQTVNDISAVAPPTLDHVTGQKAAVEMLRVALAAFWADRGAGLHPTFGPVLMEGPAGTGKTLLAGIVARELGGTLRETLGQTLGCGGDDLNELLLEATDDTVIFIDEAHLLAAPAQTLLLRALEERKLFLPRGAYATRATAIPLARFTLLLATTNPEGLLHPLRDRMKVHCQFGFYTRGHLMQILYKRARALGWDVDQNVFLGIARCAKRTPRLALRLLESCRRTGRAEGADAVTTAHFNRTLELEGLEPRLGLDQHEQAYLRALVEGNGKVRLGSLALKLGMAPFTVATVVERFIVREGLVARTETGRELTDKGRQFLRVAPVDPE
jgi:Holliday junction DNA helicase RuvB